MSSQVDNLYSYFRNLYDNKVDKLIDTIKSSPDYQNRFKELRKIFSSLIDKLSIREGKALYNFTCSENNDDLATKIANSEFMVHRTWSFKEDFVYPKIKAVLSTIDDKNDFDAIVKIIESKVQVEEIFNEFKNNN